MVDRNSRRGLCSTISGFSSCPSSCLLGATSEHGSVENGGARSLARASPGSPGISLGSTIGMELTIATFVFS